MRTSSNKDTSASLEPGRAQQETDHSGQNPVCAREPYMEDPLIGSASSSVPLKMPGSPIPDWVPHSDNPCASSSL